MYMWRVQTMSTSALCCSVSSGSRLHVSEEANDLVLDATVLAQVWHLDIGSALTLEVPNSQLGEYCSNSTPNAFLESVLDTRRINGGSEKSSEI